MSRKREDIISSLIRKGFEEKIGDHHHLIYHQLDGLISTRRTKISRGKNYAEVGDNLLSLMARQIGLTKAQFLELVDCPMDQKKYEQVAQFGRK